MTTPSETLADELERQIAQVNEFVCLTKANALEILALLRSQPQGQAGEPVGEIIEAANADFGDMRIRIIKLATDAPPMPEGTPLYAAAPPAAEGWLPIESAPHGRKLLGAYKNSLGNWRRILMKYYEPETLESEHTESGFADEGWYEETEVYEELAPVEYEPTYWQHLPTAPQKGRT